jgi:LemA protein
MLNILNAGAATGGSFAEDTRLYERSVDSTNVLLDLWWAWLAAFAVLVLYWTWRRSNRVTALLDQRCRAAFHDIDALLQERHSLVPNLVEVTRQHLATNQQVLDKLLEAQARALDSLAGHRMKAETLLGDAINSVINIAGKAPDLKSSEVFTTLRDDLVRIEEKITAARRYYNTTVGEYNTVVNSWPSSLFVRFGTKSTHEFFSVDERREELAQPIAISLA